jgi:hypothetical protein
MLGFELRSLRVKPILRGSGGLISACSTGRDIEDLVVVVVVVEVVVAVGVAVVIVVAAS